MRGIFDKIREKLSRRSGSLKLAVLNHALSLMILAAVFAPFYFIDLYNVPYQINTDEISVMDIQRWESSQNPPDLFGLSDYFGFPKFIFIAYGWLQRAFWGGINLQSARAVNALFGLLSILLSYFLFTPYWPRIYAFAGAVVLGANHSLVAISRMALRDNTGVLIEIAALVVLFRGLKNKSFVQSFCGGILLGLSFYVYYPARAAVILWAIFTVLAGVFFKKEWPLRKLLLLSLASAFGLILVASPVIIASFKSDSWSDYVQAQLLLFREGREIQKNWVFADSEIGGFAENVKNGLTVFNNQEFDRGFIYPNYGHGFVDPLSGMLLWVGLAAFAVSAFKNGILPFSLMMFSSLVFLYFSFAFIVNKAPNYTRLLVILPFFSFFVVYGIKFISEFLRNNARTRNFDSLFIIVSVGAILFWNLSIFHDFVRDGRENGHEIGSTARYIEGRKNAPDHQFFIAASREYPYFVTNGGHSNQWRFWASFFGEPRQKFEVIPPGQYDLLPSGAFTVFISRGAWLETGREIRARYPAHSIHKMKVDGSLLAIEIP